MVISANGESISTNNTKLLLTSIEELERQVQKESFDRRWFS